ncbi:hypothetical protein ACQP1V_27525 [Microtetraspora malaysiensis]|uniref:hypothetical protein n=1 Tax=Microtetraspora malaysiensis TaxID=161358 RepID=UPI003D90C82D
MAAQLVAPARLKPVTSLQVQIRLPQAELDRRINAAEEEQGHTYIARLDDLMEAVYAYANEHGLPYSERRRKNMMYITFDEIEVGFDSHYDVSRGISSHAVTVHDQKDESGAAFGGLGTTLPSSYALGKHVPVEGIVLADDAHGSRA